MRILAASLLAILFLPSAHSQFKAGVSTRRFILARPYNWRGAETHALVTTIWYPAEAAAAEQPQWIGAPDAPLFSAAKAAPDAPLASAPGKFPLVLISHGTGGTALMMGWLGAHLAARGYIAAAVNHPGNNGTETYTAAGFTLWWERATDLSVVIDQLLADSTFGRRIDPQRIGAAGFSLGGYTVIEIAGGITRRSSYRDFCRSPRADGICKPPPEFPEFMTRFEQLDDLAKTDAEIRESLRHESESHRDPRIHAVFAMAPALGPAFPADGLAGISIPVAIVAGAADENVPIASSAKYFADHIPNAELTLFERAPHYVFLGACTDQGRKIRPVLCSDPPGINRESLHRETAAMATHFFDDHLGVTLPAELARVLEDYQTAWRAKDATALAGLFAEDGFVLSPGHSMVRGRKAIESFYRGHGGPLALRGVAYAGDGNAGYIIGAYSSWTGAQDDGKFTLTLRKDASGRWLIMSDMDNGNRHQ
ncbi:MAG: SgcJ/EcaC family oxidoreductase [Acidobacteriota bacterium]|nr:SgcJ/EcaC family oxidoreductase [Acidobacteriota bacterium]